MSQPLTVKDLDAFVEQIQKKREEVAAAKEQLKIVSLEHATLQAKAIALLEELGRKNYPAPFGTISVVEKWRVNLPKNDQEMEKLFQHLRERGIYEEYATVNSNSLNSLYLADWEEARKDGKGMEFFMPGVDAPKLHKELRFTKGKAK